MFVDSHCHILSEYYLENSIENIIYEAKKNKVKALINSGFDQKSNEEIITLIDKYNEIYGTIGIHPNNINEVDENNINYIIKNITNNKIVAIGEIGLDYHYGSDNKDSQFFWFKKQLELASKYNLPVVIHSRDATADTINILKQFKVKGVIHSFSGSLETAREYIKLGFLLGINGTITFKNSKLFEVIKNLDLENIIIETDCPYLTPEPYRGQINYPKNIIYIAEYIAKLKNITLDELSIITNKNIKRIFDI